MHIRADQLLSQLLTLNICMKEFGSQESINEKVAAMSTLTFFRLVSTKRGYACSMIVHTRADHFLPQLLMELFDIFYAQC